jgi:hypothetical protein
VAFTEPDRASRRLRWRGATILVGVALVAWLSRGRVLTAVGSAVVVDDAPAPVEVMVASLAAVRADALEVAKLYHDGVSRRIVVARWQDEPLDAEVRRLGVPWLAPHDLVVAMLVKSHVPATAIQVLEDHPVDGLNTEVAAIAAFARATRPASLLYVTARSHSGRACRLLHRLLPEHTTVRVHASALDPFHPDAWWQSRTGSRELAMEYLRWANTFGFGDWWGRRPPPSVPEPQD